MSHILLIEDNPQNADMAIHILQTAGFTVKHFLRGIEGAANARKERPALILLDFDLPDIDGRTLILSLRKQLGGAQAPPIVAVTARTGHMEMAVAQRFGCSAFVSKPYTPERLLDVIRTLLAHQATRSS
jgi:two-component system, cell cycle response regulator DivK